MGEWESLIIRDVMGRMASLSKTTLGDRTSKSITMVFSRKYVVVQRTLISMEQNENRRHL